MIQDLRFAFRVLRRNPGFAVITAVTLALGVGATTAIFTVVDAVLLERLPYPEPDRLAMVWERRLPDGNPRNVVSPPNFVDWKRQTESFAELAGFFGSTAHLSGAGEPVKVRTRITDPALFVMLGVTATVGRTFGAEEADEDVAVLSHRFWQRQFGGDASVVGTAITLDDEAVTVIGVATPAMEVLSESADIWQPTDFRWADRARQGRYIRVVGRLQPGVSVAQAQTEMDTIAERLEAAYPDYNSNWRTTVVLLREQLVGDVRLSLLVLFGAVGFLLLIACANVANLSLARATARRRELAVRASLGAGRRRVIRQLVTESLVLAVLGGLLGLGVAQLGTSLLVGLTPAEMTLPRASAIAVDGRVLGFGLAISLVTGLLFGLVPAFEASRFNLTEILKETVRDTGGGRRNRHVRAGLVVLEVALSLTLLAGAGLLVRSLTALQRVDPGLRAGGVVTARVSLPSSRYPTEDQRVRFFETLRARLETLPGFVSAGAIQFLPFTGNAAYTRFVVEDRPRPPLGEWPTTGVRVVDVGYFRTVGIPLLHGRVLSERDRPDAPPVVVVSETLASRFWPGEDPLGKRLSYSWGGMFSVEVVGVVGDVRHDGLDREARAEIYRPLGQMSDPGSMTYVVRADGDMRALNAAITGSVRALDPLLPVTDVRALPEIIAGSVAARRFNMLLLTLFAVLAATLAVVGVYGVMSHFVAARTHEIGVRMALGARAIDTLGLVMRQGASLIGAGLVAGLIGAWALSRLVASLLFGVSATDAVTYGAVAVLLGGVALLASAIPARRAAAVDPMTALRVE